MIIEKPEIGIGLIGSGFMGRCHANAFHTVAGLFELPAHPRCEILADVTDEIATSGADALGFVRATSNWQALIIDPAVDIVAIGIGHDVTRYYRRAVTLMDAEQLGGTMMDSLAELFDDDEKKKTSRGRNRAA